MTDTAAPGFAALSTAPDTAAVCPYLLAADAGWRSANASRDHRCHAVAPAALLASDKQRRLCLVAEHTDCSTYRAATSAIDDLPISRVEPDHRPVTRTAPLVLDRGRLAISMPGLPERGAGQGALVGLMVVAFGALAVTRLGGGPGIAPAAAGPGSPSPTVAASAAAPPAPSVAATPDAPVRTLVPSDVEPTPTSAATPTATPEPTATPRASPTEAPASYTVQSGDTLSGIASRHGTTWQVLADLNDIDDPRRLRVGQVIKLP